MQQENTPSASLPETIISLHGVSKFYQNNKKIKHNMYTFTHACTMLTYVFYYADKHFSVQHTLIEIKYLHQNINHKMLKKM